MNVCFLHNRLKKRESEESKESKKERKRLRVCVSFYLKTKVQKLENQSRVNLNKLKRDNTTIEFKSSHLNLKNAE